MAPEELNQFLQEQDACVIAFDETCPGCMRNGTLKERFLLLDIPWDRDGRQYSRSGTFVCCKDIEERQLLKNMIYMLKELRRVWK